MTPNLKRFIAVLAVGFGVSGGISAQEPFKDFTFKRVKVPDRSVGKRITIQIDPSAQESAPQRAPEAAPKPPKDMAEWFWGTISPRIEDASALRINRAVAHLSNAPTGDARFRGDIARLKKLSDQYGKEILIASLGKRVSPAFILAVIAVESGGRADAVSSAGAQGLMQLIPDTAKRFDVVDPTDPKQNIAGGAAYLEWLLKEFSGDPLLALAGYNAGENAVRKNNGVPDYAETRAYVPKVLAAWQVARSLCKTPPELVSDGCVFR